MFILLAPGQFWLQKSVLLSHPFHPPGGTFVTSHQILPGDGQFHETEGEEDQCRNTD